MKINSNLLPIFNLILKMAKLLKYQLAILFACFCYQLQAQKTNYMVYINQVSGETERFDVFPLAIPHPFEGNLFTADNLIATRTPANTIEFTNFLIDTDTIIIFSKKQPSFLNSFDKLYGLSGTAAQYMMAVYFDAANKQYRYVGFDIKNNAVTKNELLNNIKEIHPTNGVYNKTGQRYYFITTDSNNTQNIHIYEYDNEVLRNAVPLVSSHQNYTIRGLIYSKNQNKIYAIEKDLNNQNNYLVSIDSGNGTIQRIKQLEDVDSFMHAKIIADANNQYVFVGKDVDGLTKLYTIDLLNGDILHQPNFAESDFTTQNGEYVVPLGYMEGRLVGISRQEANGWIRPLNYITFIPNAFTPNTYGPDRNNRFYVHCYKCVYYKIQIFDRKGVTIFSGAENKSWDGTYNGEPVSNGVFGYKVLTLDERGNEHTYIGNITVLVE